MKGLGRTANGLRAARTLLDVAGENIANQDSEGYHRKKAHITAVPGVSSRRLSVGLGATVEEISRVRSELTERSLIANTQVRKKAEQTVDVLDKLESSFQEPSETAFDARLGDLFDKIRRLSSDPASSNLRRAVVQKAESVSAGLNRLDNEMERLRDHMRETLDSRVGRVNELSENIASLNKKILHASAQGKNPTALKDKRENAVSELAELVNVETHTTDEGHTNISVGGTLLVSGGNSSKVELQNKGDELHLTRKDTPVQVKEGSLGGLINMLNDGLPRYRDKLDALANGLRRSFNRLHTTALPSSGRFKRLNGSSAFHDNATLQEHGYFVPAVTNGELIVNVENTSSDEVSQTKLTGIDTTQGANDLVQQVANKLNSVSNLNASENNGSLQIEAGDGYTFGFATPYDPDPASASSFSTASPPEVNVLGSYEGQKDLTYSVSFAGSGTLGTDPVDVNVTVEDSAGNAVDSYTRTVGPDWKSTDELSLDNGLSLNLTEGGVAVGDSFSFTARANTDPQGLLNALGVNTMFDGVGAGGIKVSERLADNPEKLAGSLQAHPSDNQRLLDMLKLQDKNTVESRDLHGFYRDLVGEVATTRKNKKTQLSNLKDIHQRLQDAHDSTSGVSVEEEMMQIYKGQRIYRGVTKYMQALDKSYQNLLRTL